jgi:molybdopterin-guanine dinucleotide biosynthesis protein A
MVPRPARLRGVTYDAIVLAGGQSTRLGVDKAALVVDGVTMLDRVLTACADAVSTVVVGPSRPAVRPVHWTLEDPPSGGPVAGIAAGLVVGTAPVVVVLSCDLPWLTPADTSGLVESLGDYDGYGLRDSSGREQYLAAAYRRSPLTEAVDMLGDPRDKAVRHLVAGLRIGWTVPTRAGDDVDTWADLD